MILTWPFLWLVGEGYLFFWLVSQYDFLSVFGAYLAPSLLGFMILSFQSRMAFIGFQQKIQQGRDPGFQALHMAAKFVSGLLFIAPFAGTRLLAVLLILPGTRHFLIAAGHRWVRQKMASGQFVFMGGGHGAGPGRGFGVGFRPGGGRPGGAFGYDDFEGPREERDAQVIDIKKIE